MTIGNHDLSHGPTMDYLYDKLHQSFDKISMPFITSNIIYSNNNQTFGDFFRYRILENGIRVLMLGFMYTSTNEYPNTRVDGINYTFNSEQFQNVMKKYAKITDIVLLNLHISALEPENDLIYKYIRQIFKEQLNYTVPIHVLSAHFHMVSRISCAINDNSCINTETGSYLQRIEHTVWTLNTELNVSNSNSTFKGSSVIKLENFPFNYLIVENSTQGEGLAKRFNINPLQFDTQNALALRSQIMQQCNELNLSQIVAFSKFKYTALLNKSHPYALQRLYTYSVSPSLVINSQLEKSCCQFTMTKQDLVRVDIQKGPQTLDQVYIVIPYLYDMVYLHELSPMQARCIYNWISYKPWDWLPNNNTLDSDNIFGDPIGMFPFYVIPNDTWDQQCYDIVTDTMEAQRMYLAYETCGMTGPDMMPYTTSSQINRTDKIWMEYSLRFMQNQTINMNSGDKYFHSSEYMLIAIGIAWCCLVVIAAIITLIQVLGQKISNYKEIEEEVENTSQVSM